MNVLSKILLPSMKLVWLGLIMCGRNTWILLANVLAKTLYVLPKSVISLQLLSLEWSPDLGMRVIIPLLM